MIAVRMETNAEVTMPAMEIISPVDMTEINVAKPTRAYISSPEASQYLDLER